MMDAAVVYCVVCVDLQRRREDDDTIHIFSTPEKRRAFMDADTERGHVAYDYIVDAPEAHEGRRN